MLFVLCTITVVEHEQMSFSSSFVFVIVVVVLARLWSNQHKENIKTLNCASLKSSLVFNTVPCLYNCSKIQLEESYNVTDKPLQKNNYETADNRRK